MGHGNKGKLNYGDRHQTGECGGNCIVVAIADYLGVFRKLRPIELKPLPFLSTIQSLYRILIAADLGVEFFLRSLSSERLLKWTAGGVSDRNAYCCSIREFVSR